MAVDLIPGTALPLHVGPGGYQTEGRGEIVANREREPVAMVAGEDVDGLDPRTLRAVGRLIDRADRAERAVRKTIFATTAGQTDATTGNLIRALFTVPQGMQGHVTTVTIDCPGSASINPTAPYANGSSYAYLSVASGSSGDSAANADGYRGGMVAFAPTSAAGPILPGQWTFTSSQAPVVQGNETLYFVLHGGSVAAIKALQLQITYRIELFGTNQ